MSAWMNKWMKWKGNFRGYQITKGICFVLFLTVMAKGHDFVVLGQETKKEGKELKMFGERE